MSLRDELTHEPLVGADLGTAAEDWMMALAVRSADWYQRVTGVTWTLAGRAFFLGRLTAICRHWSDPSGHGLFRGWHLNGGESRERAPWTSKREREICWPSLEPRPVCRRQSDAVTRLVLGTPTCPGHFDLLRGDPDAALPPRVVLSWANAVAMCDPVASLTCTNARYQKIRAAAARYLEGRAAERAWEADHAQLDDVLGSARFAQREVG